MTMICAFLNFFDILTPMEDWTEIPGSPGCWITRDGRVRGRSGTILKRFLDITGSAENDYDKIASGVVFKDGEDWADIPGTGNKIHRNGIVRNSVSNKFASASVQFNGSLEPVYMLIMISISVSKINTPI
jgi:hypothetical protein